MCALALTIGSEAVSQQVAVTRIEQMPSMPSPYDMRDWKAVALGYDSLVYDFGRQGTYLPLIWWNSSTLNYPGETSFGLHTVVGTTVPNSTEAINVIPSVIGATLCGIDKSSQDGQNWVRMCREYFNRANGENVYLNSPGARSGDDWWYDTMPNLFFYQLAWLYPGTPDFEEQFISVADRWLHAVRVLGGSTTPWSIPSTQYRAFALKTSVPLASGVLEPEAAGAMGWLLYMAYVHTGDRKYREGAEQCMETLSGLSSNPSYELQLGYGTLLAARMNAELNTAYNTEKLVNWCFDVGPLRSWGAIVGTWGGLDCSGLIGEVNGSNDYAFFMNGCELAGALAPMVRYDTRFARAIGRWMLNLANASRLFYPKYLPDQNQDSRDWSRQYDTASVIAHEAMHRSGGLGVSPYASGDAILGGWGLTNLAIYGSSHAGILGGIVHATAVPGVLLLDLLKTDYYHQKAFPTYLVYNPHSDPITVTVPGSAGLAASSGFQTDRHVPRGVSRNPALQNRPGAPAEKTAAGAVDVYDAASHTYLVKGMTGDPAITVPPDVAVVAVIVPAGGSVTYRGRSLLIDSVVVDFAGSASPVNLPPRIKGLGASPPSVTRGGEAMVYVTPVDPEGDSLTAAWSSRTGVLSPSGDRALWHAPASKGTGSVVCVVADAHGAAVSDSVLIDVSDSTVPAPRILRLRAKPRKLQPGETSIITCSASDPGRLPVTFNWSASGGTISGQDSSVQWTAPGQEGDYWLRCLVANDSGSTARDSISVEARVFAAYGSGSLLAWYPLDGDGTDNSAHANNGIASMTAPAPDRFGAGGHALEFGASGSVVLVPDRPYLNTAGAITVSFWLDPLAFFTREQYPVSHGSWQNRWKASIGDSLLRWTVRTSVSVADLDSRTVLGKQRYYHAVLVYSGREMEIYLNGELDAFRPWSGTLLPAARDLTIGEDLPGSSAYGFSGDIDDVRLFDYALQPPAVQQLFSATASAHANESAGVPERMELEQNYPNPFNPETTIRFALPQGCSADLRVADLLGRNVAVLIHGRLTAGRHTVPWNAGNLPSGCYFVTLSAGASRLTMRALLVK